MDTGQSVSYPEYSWLLGFGFFCLLVLGYSDLALACPMCRDLIEHGKDALQALRFGRGIAWSMLLMFSVPFLLVGGTVFVLVRANRRAEARAAAEERGGAEPGTRQPARAMKDK